MAVIGRIWKMLCFQAQAAVQAITGSILPGNRPFQEVA